MLLLYGRLQNLFRVLMCFNAFLQELLEELLPLEDADIRAWLPRNRDRLSLDFLLWLADR